ncbi:uncharacterized protein CANTADRAFT_3914 [Suhomyces tanzawaensis NRRL Y-17324]|uniref:Uncharacterized protein n=1 Tax=Suhomyces tanzawaensis NRRL Y-17324 TaxID=984487 RepID=A0A1E4SQR9_9ASCO|nr:uncharacterized protein CANTADRAFT_3914 [Suhomyces tanzawaensis NRRL Y-17324]ODV81854.1 hypothetical protein CANTADRAFT_3914 [Suhomyces tanzawaensis NRRL Y-17324]
MINQPLVFGHPVHQYTTVREFPIMNTFLQLGVEVFESQQAFEGGERALWQTSTSVMSVFKRGAPFMVIRNSGSRDAGHMTNNNEVTVHFRVILSHVLAYVLQFAAPTPPVVVMNNNSSRPTADFEYRNTKLRVVGVTGTTSTFGNGLLKVFVMKPDTAMLSDGVVLRLKNKPEVHNRMLLVVESQDRGLIQAEMRAQEFLVHHPIATFREEETKVLGRILRSGTMRVFGREVLGEAEFVLVCVLLVLREQEGRKNRGYGRPREMEGPGQHK